MSVALEQLDAFALAAVQRTLSGFARVSEEAEEFQEKVFRELMQIPGEGELGDLAEFARDEAITYYQTLREMEQAIINLLAVGLYHLYEQQRDRIQALRAEAGLRAIELSKLEGWARVEELRLVANSVKHAEGRSAADLRIVRPDLFVDPIVAQTRLAKWAGSYSRPLRNPLGGVDLFVTRADLEQYRVALRELLEHVASST